MSTQQDVPKPWQIGYVLLLINPFIGLAYLLFDMPVWLEVIGLVAIVTLVGVGATMLRHRPGGWRPSETLVSPNDHE